MVWEVAIGRLSELVELCTDLRLISGRNSKLLTVCKSVLFIFDAGAADFSACHTAVSASHVLFAVSWLQELNSLKFWLLLFLLGLLFLLLDKDSRVLLLTEVTGSHMLTTFIVIIILLDRLIVALRVESLVGHVVVGGSILHLAID